MWNHLIIFRKQRSIVRKDFNRPFQEFSFQRKRRSGFGFRYPCDFEGKIDSAGIGDQRIEQSLPILPQNALIGFLPADEVSAVDEVVAPVFPNGAFQYPEVFAPI